MEPFLRDPFLSFDWEPHWSWKLEPLLSKTRAQKIAAAAAALAEHVDGFATADFAKLLAESAGAYANSPWDHEAVARLTDAAAGFIVFFTNQEADAPQGTAAIKEVLQAAAGALPPVRHLPTATKETKEAQPNRLRKLDLSTFADATGVLAAELDGTALSGIARAFAYHASKLAASPDDVDVRVLLGLGAMVLEVMAQDTQQVVAVSDLVVAAGAVLNFRRRPWRFHGTMSFLRASFVRAPVGPAATGTPEDEEWVTKHLEDVEKLQNQSVEFAEMATNSSMAAGGAAFSKVVNGLTSENDRDKRAAYRDLGDVWRKLLVAAMQANASEASITAAAKVLSSNSLKLSFSERARRPVKGYWCPDCCGLDRCLASISWPRLPLPTGCCSGCCVRLRAAICGPEETLPTDVQYAARKAKAIAKHQVLLGIALATPVVLLTSARENQIFPAGHAVWIAGSSLAIWILVSGGMLLNQYGKTRMELQIARHMSRFGLLGLTVLLCFYTFFAFFPGFVSLLWGAVAATAAIHGCLWIMSCVRGDEEDNLATSARDTE